MLDQLSTAEALRARRTHDLLATVPDLVVYLLERRVPSLEQRDADGSQRTSGAHAPLPLRAAPLDAADDLYARLAIYALEFARLLDEAPPATLIPFSLADRNPTGLPWETRSGPRLARQVVINVVAWLRRHGPTLDALPGSLAADYHEEVHDLLSSLHGSFPMGPWIEPWPVSPPCPVCREDRMRVWVTPAAIQHAPAVAEALEGQPAPDYTAVCGLCGWTADGEAVDRMLAAAADVA